MYTPVETAAWLSAGELAVDRSWPIDTKLAECLLVHVCPLTENDNVRKNSIERGELAARVLQAGTDQDLIRLDECPRMRRDLYQSRTAPLSRPSWSGL